MSDNFAIQVHNIHKTFRIPLDGGSSLKQKIVHFTKRQKGYREFSPLNGISFDVEEGEFFGIVGRNGSGKSTLLKTIAGIYEPDKGSVHVKGKLVPFIELGVGFNPELTGRENVFLNGALLGFSRDEMKAMYDEIVDFAELHKFMEERLKNYSSGMQVRLAFSIAIRAKGDVLLLDEVLAVGDSAFQQKCYAYFNMLKKNGKTVILVTHSMAAVERFCSRALLLDKGKIVSIGSSYEIAEKYEDLFLEDGISDVKNGKKQKNNQTKVSVDLKRGQEKVDTVKFKEKLNISIDLETNKVIEAGNMGINIRNEKNEIVFSSDTRPHIGEFSLRPGETKTVQYTISNNYTNGNYSIDINIVDEVGGSGVIGRHRSVVEFISVGVVNHTHSMFHPEYSVRGV
jgi:ABC-2 type transport system ATP-binding protein